MFRANCHLSPRLSEVLDDIGVNKTVLLRRRRTMLLDEVVGTIGNRLTDGKVTRYFFGSRVEGSTTLGLNSDRDCVIYLDQYQVIHELNEWTPGLFNLMMIEDDDTPPGYCRLQLFRDDEPVLATEDIFKFSLKDIHGRVLLKNTFLPTLRDTNIFGHQGPSLMTHPEPGFLDHDYVHAFPLKSWPRSAREWLQQDRTGNWPTKAIVEYARKSRCFVVGVGSSVSENKDFEWRLSTSMAERCLMFNLNITQIRCYILMKMIIKTYVNTYYGNCITSFMCKTVLFHCIKNKDRSIWTESNIIGCLSYCLLMLYNCVLSGNCPNFIIRESNLMAGKYSKRLRQNLVKCLSKLIECNNAELFGIQIDDLGLRLRRKLSGLPLDSHLPSSDMNRYLITGSLLVNSVTQCVFQMDKLDINSKMNVVVLSKAMSNLIRYYNEGNMFEKTACCLIAPHYCTLIGSLMASNNIRTNNIVSSQALAWMSAGSNSDVSSSRLKLASVFYCSGDIERTAGILRDVEGRYDTKIVEQLCCCYACKREKVKYGFCRSSSDFNEEGARHLIALCVRFRPCEINCVPRELQYEFYRSTKQELNRRTSRNQWMNDAIADSLTILFFLQYKTFGHLHNESEQQRALLNLRRQIETEQTIGHRETAWNLLGQCFEQEDRPNDALKCYMKSLEVRGDNNAARLHVCILLAKFVASTSLVRGLYHFISSPGQS